MAECILSSQGALGCKVNLADSEFENVASTASQQHQRWVQNGVWHVHKSARRKPSKLFATSHSQRHAQAADVRESPRGSCSGSFVDPP